MTDLEWLNHVKVRLASVELALAELASLSAERDQLRSLKAVYQHRLGLTGEDDTSGAAQETSQGESAEAAAEQGTMAFTRRLIDAITRRPGMDFGTLYTEVEAYVNPDLDKPRRNVSSVMSTLVKNRRVRKVGERFYPAK